jgi:hypothetical protein
LNSSFRRFPIITFVQIPFIVYLPHFSHNSSMWASSASINNPFYPSLVISANFSSIYRRTPIFLVQRNIIII